MEVIGQTKDANGYTWYEVRWMDKDGKEEHTGYVRSDVVDANEAAQAVPTVPPDQIPPTPTPETVKEYPHLINWDGKTIPFGVKEYEDKAAGETFNLLNGIILKEPYQKTVPVYDRDGNIVLKYNLWFIQVGYPDPKKKGKMVTKEVAFWGDEFLPGIGVGDAPNNRIPNGLHWHTERDRETVLELFQKDKPIQVWLFSKLSDKEWKEGEKYIKQEKWPGNSKLGKWVWFLKMLLGHDPKHHIKVDYFSQVIIAPNQ